MRDCEHDLSISLGKLSGPAAFFGGRDSKVLLTSDTVIGGKARDVSGSNGKMSARSQSLVITEVPLKRMFACSSVSEESEPSSLYRGSINEDCLALVNLKAWKAELSPVLAK